MCILFVKIKNPIFFTCSFFISLQGAKLPMSIIIVGVGQAEFDGTVPYIL